MNLNLTFPYTAAGYAFLAGLLFIVLKLIAAILQIRLAGGNYRRFPDTALFRTVYIVGKVTPALAALSLCVSSILKHDQRHSWMYGLVAVFAASLAAFVVYLREQGRFFGMLDMLSRKHE
jgi:Kef-type K+ transport system membrane component KefB